MEVRRLITPEPSALDHARRLVERLQDEPSFAGNLVPASDIEWLYYVLCEDEKWKQWPWQSVAAQLRRLTGGTRLYRRVDGRNVRVYPIPTPPVGARIASTANPDSTLTRK